MTEKPTRCPKCNQFKFYHNKGVSSKTGKPWENHKCANKECNYIEWVEQEKIELIPVVEEMGMVTITREKFNEGMDKLWNFFTK